MCQLKKQCAGTLCTKTAGVIVDSMKVYCRTEVMERIMYYLWLPEVEIKHL